MVNMKVRLKNKVFWAQIIAAVAGPVLTYMGLTAADLTTWAKVWEVITAAAANPYVVLMIVIAILNAVNDPTTKGIADSARAQGYDTPQ